MGDNVAGAHKQTVALEAELDDERGHGVAGQTSRFVGASQDEGEFLRPKPRIAPRVLSRITRGACCLL